MPGGSGECVGFLVGLVVGFKDGRLDGCKLGVDEVAPIGDSLGDDEESSLGGEEG